MKLIKVKCQNCGANLEIPDNKKTILCAHCRSLVQIPNAVTTTIEINKKRFGFSKRTIITLLAVALIFVVFGIVMLYTFSKENPKQYFKAGVYLVGTDIPAGDYVFKVENFNAKLEVRKTKDRVINFEDLLYTKKFSARQWVNLNEGDYIEFSNCKLYKPEYLKIEPQTTEGYQVGQYKVGVDILAGEYIIVADINDNIQSFSSKMPESVIYDKSVTAKESEGKYRSYIILTEGEYISFNRGRLYELKHAPKIIKFDDNTFYSGQYKLGIDIPFGIYGFDNVDPNTSRFYLTGSPQSATTIGHGFLKHDRQIKITDEFYFPIANSGSYVIIKDPNSLYLKPLNCKLKLIEKENIVKKSQ